MKKKFSYLKKKIKKKLVKKGISGDFGFIDIFVMCGYVILCLMLIYM